MNPFLRSIHYITLLPLRIFFIPAFYGTNRQYALGDTDEQRYMGQWSDDTPIHEPVVTNEP